MKYECPHCGKPLRGALFRAKPAPGERRILPNRAIPYCSGCGGLLRTNIHPAEAIELALVLVPFALLKLSMEYRSTTLAILAGLSVVLFVIGSSYYHLKYLRDWPRFKAHEQSEPRQ